MLILLMNLSTFFNVVLLYLYFNTSRYQPKKGLVDRRFANRLSKTLIRKYVEAEGLCLWVGGVRVMWLKPGNISLLLGEGHRIAWHLHTSPWWTYSWIKLARLGFGNLLSFSGKLATWPFLVEKNCHKSPSAITWQRADVSCRKVYQTMRKIWPVVIINDRAAFQEFWNWSIGE